MAIDFDMATAEMINDADDCSGCCPELTCPKATATIRSRETDSCRGGFEPNYKIPTTPAHDGHPEIPGRDGFDLTQPAGTLIPLYTIRDTSYHSTEDGSTAATAKKFDEDESVTATAETSTAWSYDNTDSFREEVGVNWEDLPASTANYSDYCPPLNAITAVGPPTFSVALEDGAPDYPDYLKVVISYGDARPEDPTSEEDPPAKLGEYVAMIDDGGGTTYEDPDKFITYILKTDHTCHEVRMIWVGGGTAGKWSDPNVFSNDYPCGECAPAPMSCGDYHTGNTLRTNPTGFPDSVTGTDSIHVDGSDDISWTGSRACPDPDDPAPSMPSELGISTRDISTPATEVWTQSLHTTGGTLHRVKALDPTDMTDVSATGVTVDGDGNITGGTLTSGTGGGGTHTGGTLTGGTITGGTLVGGVLTGGTLTGATLDGGTSTNDDTSDSHGGWRQTSASYDYTATGENKVELSNDINTGATLADTLFDEAYTAATALDEHWGWGSADVAGAKVIWNWPHIGGTVSAIYIFVHLIEMRFKWQVDADYDGTKFQVKWDVAFFSDAWLVWREAKIKWALAQYAYLNRPMPGDDDYPDEDDYETHDEYLAAIDAIQKDPSVFPPDGWTADPDHDGFYTKGDLSYNEETLRSIYNLYEDPGDAPTAPEVMDSGDWTWTSDQGESDPETVDPCDPTYSDRVDLEPVLPDDPTPEQVEDWETDHAAWEARRDAASLLSKKSSPWTIFTPTARPTETGIFMLANVRYICDPDDPLGPLENYDSDRPTTTVPELDPTTTDPDIYAEWYYGHW